ncbi:hypothetical protein PBOI14_54590 [Pseudomonas sp. Boi14]|nr:hypothetical protein PBOI14_54590 [Pseudomonas sp. Boi14]
MWGARLALAAPQRIDGLVLMDTYLGAEPAPTRQYYFSLFQQIEDSGLIAEPLLDIVVPIFFRPGSIGSRRCSRNFVPASRHCRPSACARA